MNFGDGQSELNRSQPTFTHAYAAYGDYTITLTVKDTEGASASMALHLRCGLNSSARVNISQTQYFSNLCSTDFDGGNVFAAWRKREGKSAIPGPRILAPAFAPPRTSRHGAPTPWTPTSPARETRFI